MNLERMEQLISVLENPDTLFNMEEMLTNSFTRDVFYEVMATGDDDDKTVSEALYTCDSAVCIIGHVLCLAHMSNERVAGMYARANRCVASYSAEPFIQAAANWLDIPYDDMKHIGYPPNSYEIGVSYGDITPPMAVDMLRHYVKTGEVNWSMWT